MEKIIQSIAVLAIPLIFGMTLPQTVQAYAARYLGDNGPYLMGRAAINPIKHIDPVWTIIVPLVSMLLTGFLFGGAKPLFLNEEALRNPKRDMALIAATGPLANLAMMVGWAIVAKIVIGLPSSGPVQYLTYVAVAGIKVNAVLALFNLLPIPPLPGGRIVTALLPQGLSEAYRSIERYGMIILVVLLLSGFFSVVLGPLVDTSVETVYSVLRIS
jgi:Zn-dependent protease